MKTTSNALDVMRRLTGDGPAVQTALRRAHLNFDIAEMIYSARTSAGLTQRALAQLVGTRQSVIARLEDVDYEGHSLTMLQRIATALGRRVEVRLTRIAKPRKEDPTVSKKVARRPARPKVA